MQGLTRRNVPEFLVILPDGTRTLIPVAWTDCASDGGDFNAASLPDGGVLDNLCTVDDLVKARVVVDYLLRRHSESASCQEGDHAVEVSVSRARRGRRRSADVDLERHRPQGTESSTGSTVTSGGSDAGGESQQGDDR